MQVDAVREDLPIEMGRLNIFRRQFHGPASAVLLGFLNEDGTPSREYFRRRCIGGNVGLQPVERALGTSAGHGAQFVMELGRDADYLLRNVRIGVWREGRGNLGWTAPLPSHTTPHEI